jgi:propanol-preferring alcohol dehydrogenase
MTINLNQEKIFFNNGIHRRNPAAREGSRVSAGAENGGNDMNKTMKAAIIREFGKPLSIEQIPVPQPGEGQILVKIVASGVCHTDIHAADGDWPVKPKLPLIPGHEGVGYVAALGKGVTWVKEGDRVGIPWLHTSCGYCEYCISGWETPCVNQKNSGYSLTACW